MGLYTHFFEIALPERLGVAAGEMGPVAKVRAATLPAWSGWIGGREPSSIAPVGANGDPWRHHTPPLYKLLTRPGETDG